ncbi:MAG: hypothetical protein HY982_02480 [Candidatus Magasanikbacteria bacterium]|nr:hypothetical protein [Candidatus Magasanikbacteria bacterium]
MANEDKLNQEETEIFTIPEEFYGAVKRNPPVSPPPVFLSKAGGAFVSPEAMPFRGAAGGPPPRHLNIKSPKFILLITAVVVILAVAGFAFYYIRQAQNIKNKLAAQEAAPPAPKTEEMPALAPPSPPSPPLEETATTTPAPPPLAAPIFPFKDYVKAADADNDGLTDKEEFFYATDAVKPDSDADGYVDGLEVENLYNPLGFKPVKLIDSGRVEIYANPTYGYSIFYPKGWLAQALDANNEEVIFSSDTGEFVEVRAEDNLLKMAVADWYLAQSPGVKAEDLRTVKTKEGGEGVLSPDSLTVYLPFEDKIFLINYNIGLKTEVNFLTTFKMMTASFKAPGAGETLKEGETFSAGAPATSSAPAPPAPISTTTPSTTGASPK